jgi:hypothetical protein
MLDVMDRTFSRISSAVVSHLMDLQSLFQLAANDSMALARIFVELKVHGALVIPQHYLSTRRDRPIIHVRPQQGPKLSTGIP